MTRLAVLATGGFDSTTEDVRYRFGSPTEVGDGGAGPVRHRVEDVTVTEPTISSFFRTAETGFGGDEQEAERRWNRDESREHGLSGRDVVTMVDGRYGTDGSRRTAFIVCDRAGVRSDRYSGGHLLRSPSAPTSRRSITDGIDAVASSAGRTSNTPFR